MLNVAVFLERRSRKRYRELEEPDSLPRTGASAEAWRQNPSMADAAAEGDSSSPDSDRDDDSEGFAPYGFRYVTVKHAQVVEENKLLVTPLFPVCKHYACSDNGGT